MNGSRNSTPVIDNDIHSLSGMGYDGLFSARIENAKDKRRILAPKTPYWRIQTNIEKATDILQTIFFQCHTFHEHIVALIEANGESLELPHPKHKKTVLILTLQDRLIELTCPHLEGLNIEGKTEPQNFELILKVCRRLQDPISIFDYFLEVFGEPKKI